MHPFTTPSFQTWLAHAATEARRSGVPVGAVVGGSLKKKACAARKKAWEAVLQSNPAYSIAGLARTCGWDHSTIVKGLRRVVVERSAETKGFKRDKNRARTMRRREFSEYVIRANSELDMTAEEFAEATGLSLRTILARAKAAGIVMRRDSPFKIGSRIKKATKEELYLVDRIEVFLTKIHPHGNA